MWFRKSVGGTSSLSATRDDDFYVLDDVGEKLQTIVSPPPPPLGRTILIVREFLGDSTETTEPPSLKKLIFLINSGTAC